MQCPASRNPDTSAGADVVPATLKASPANLNSEGVDGADQPMFVTDNRSRTRQVTKEVLRQRKENMSQRRKVIVYRSTKGRKLQSRNAINAKVFEMGVIV